MKPMTDFEVPPEIQRAMDEISSKKLSCHAQNTPSHVGSGLTVRDLYGTARTKLSGAL